MKKKIINGAGLCLAAALLAACFQTITSNEPVPAGLGIVRLSIAGYGARTLFPVMSGFSYSALFTADGKEPVSKGFSGGGGVFPLEAGTWNITVSVKDGETEIGTGAVNAVVVSEGISTTAPPVFITPVSGGTGGSFSWQADFPALVTSAELLLITSAGAPVNGFPLDLLTVSENITVNGTIRSGTASLAPGSYLAKLRLTNSASGLSAGALEAVHIYSGQTTSAAWEYNTADFSNSRDFSGSVTINASDKITITSAELSLYDAVSGGVPFETITLTAGAGNAWNFSGGVPEIYSNVYAALTITTAHGNIALDRELVSAAEGVSLSVVTLYALNAQVSAGGALRVNGGALANNGQLDFPAGTSITLEATPNVNYQLDSLTVNGADYDGAFTLAADTDISAVFSSTASASTVWEWSYAVDGWTNLGSGSSVFTTIHGKSVKARNNDINANANGGATLPQNTRFLFGSKSTTNTSTSSYDTAGEFDFSSTACAGMRVKVTVDYTGYDPTGLSGSGRYLRICLNNNTTTAGDSVFGTLSTIGQLPVAADLTTGTLTGMFDPTELALTSQAASLDLDAVLSHSFINIALTNNSGSFCISAVKIELVP